MLYVYLIIGGAAGTLARHTLGGWVQSWAGMGFPWGTMVVNILGSFLLGLAVRWADLSGISPEFRSLLTVGFCGAFTTFSTLSYEFAALAQAGVWGRALLYAIGSLALGIAALALGMITGSFIFRVSG